MPFHERLREFKEDLKRMAHDIFTSDDHPTSVQSPSLSPNVAARESSVPESGNNQLSFFPSPIPRPAPVSSKTRRTTEDRWPSLKRFTRVLDQCAGGVGPLKGVMHQFLTCIDIYEDAAKGRKDYEMLREQLEALFKDLSSYFSGNSPPTMTICVENLFCAIENELRYINRQENRNTAARYLESTRDLDNIIECYRRIQGHLERLKLNADLSIWRIVDESATETRLSKISTAMSARYNSAEASLVRRRECTPKTREQVLAELKDWRQDKIGGNIFWMSGMAGVGKTTIANSLCAILDREHGLGASFFCSRLLPECRNINLLLPTIAYQLARFSAPFRSALSQVLQVDPDIHTQSLANQFKDMIADPLRQVAHTLPPDVVVVIDALDECEDDEGTGQILELLLAHASDLPVKFFLSSRPEPQIRCKIGGTQSQLVLHELDDKVVKEDIETYLRAELGPMSISESQLATLVKRAGVLFIYAATVVRYVGAGNFTLNPKKRLGTVLGVSTAASSNKNKDIDVLYTTILTSAFEDPDLEGSDRDLMRLVLHSVICVQEPLTVDALARLLQLGDADHVYAALQPLWSVLHVSEASKLVTPLHASFPDYILDPNRSKGYGCNAATHHGRLVELCFERINRNQRQFNICELESSYVLDEQVPDLEERVKRAIPLDLFYASQYWAVHLESGGSGNNHVSMLLEFLSKRLLLWMEILNLKKRMDTAGTQMDQARKWCMNVECSQELKELIQDAWRFVIQFAAHPVSRCTPHIYASILTSWPRSQPISDHYLPRTTGLIEIKGTGVTRRQLAQMSMFSTKDEIRTVKFSPDGTHIISGSKDGTTCVWNAQTGKIVLGPLKGGEGCVNSAMFSPDGTRIASTSNEPTICLWDARTGHMLFDPLEGHTDCVKSIAFSPDGTRFVSGSADETIALWDTQTGKIVLGPLTGHTDIIFSVAFSPDGTRIASGSEDKCIFLWDAQIGETVLDPFRGHTDKVNSVTFSPNGTRLLSSSEDGVVIVWDTQTGQMIFGLPKDVGSIDSAAFSPDGKFIVSGSIEGVIRLSNASSGQLVSLFEGHTRTVFSVAFSPDGTRIVSGSEDKTIRVWDTQSGRKAVDLLEGHASMVYCIALSHNDALIATGSSDKTIRLWDAQTRQMVISPFEGHIGPIFAIVFSPDDSRIFSCSMDTTICGWDTQTGKLVLGPLDGHTSMIISIALSPDGTRLVSGSADQSVCVWDVTVGKMVLGPLKEHTRAIYAVAFSPDGTRFASGSADMTIRIYDAQSGGTVFCLQDISPIIALAFSPDSTRIISGTYTESVVLWDAQTGQMIARAPKGPTPGASSTKFFPNGTHAISNATDGILYIWDVQNQTRLIKILEGHTGICCVISISSDGGQIISASGEGTMRGWVTPNLQNPDACELGNSWTVDTDGWVRDTQSRPLVWLPSDLHAILLRPENTFVMSRRGSVELDLTNSKLGEGWTSCYAPVPPC